MGEVVGVVGRDVPEPAGLENPVNEREQRGLHEAAAMVATFGPGVGKEEIQNIERSGW